MASACYLPVSGVCVCVCVWGGGGGGGKEGEAKEN